MQDVDFTGLQIGRFKVLAPAPMRRCNNPRPRWACQCVCGRVIELRHCDLVGGYKKSCGCAHKGELTHDHKRVFESKVMPEPNSGCWLWLGAASGRHGYGHTRHLGEQISAHRAAWLIYQGEIAPGMFVCHKCDNPHCCNPEHLFLGSHADNMRDAIRKGRINGLTPEQAAEVRSRKETQAVYASRFGVTQSAISRITNGLRNTP